MGDDVLTARVERFSHDQGFGSVVLDDGRELPFDVTVCKDEPIVGEPVRIRIGEGKSGKPKVTYLELCDARAPEPEGLPVRVAVLRLHEAGIAEGLKSDRFDQLVEELFAGDEGEADIVPLLSAYYAADPRVAVMDGWFRCRWGFHKDSADVCKDLSARVGTPPLLTLVRWSEDDVGEADYSDRVMTLHARRFDGREIERPVRSILDVITLFNEILAERADPRRFYPLETGGDWYAFYLLSVETCERLTVWRALPFYAA